MPHNYDVLEKVINETQGPPGWTFELRDEEGDKYLVILVRSQDNYKWEVKRTTGHYHPVPPAIYTEEVWRRWIFDQCLRTYTHELGELLRFGLNEERPFAPMHGPGEDPYILHDRRTDQQALTTQDGSLREGPV